LEAELYLFAADVGAVVQPLTVSLTNDGIGQVFLPSRDTFEKISPQSQPTGIVFADSSFLVFYEIVRFVISMKRIPNLKFIDFRMVTIINVLRTMFIFDLTTIQMSEKNTPTLCTICTPRGGLQAQSNCKEDLATRWTKQHLQNRFA